MPKVTYQYDEIGKYQIHAGVKAYVEGDKKRMAFVTSLNYVPIRERNKLLFERYLETKDIALFKMAIVPKRLSKKVLKEWQQLGEKK